MVLRAVFDDLVRFETVLWNALDERLRKDFAVTTGGLNVLLLIESARSCRVYDIANALAITVGGASQAVDRLERQGRIVRRPNPADRRSSLVELTPAGRELVATAGKALDEELEKHLSGPLSASALKQFAAALATLRTAAQKPEGNPS
ncbi:MarR family winged helix-turn-helix transcriptional regulator [Amycolatopsis pithecellobii]|uniref:MarR family transcriptional regulator n=1 Tax=Amycolatopsis pithecellobii TaxID=664692 RepID=A0A6N7YVX5_9PSEU|nr:MarR family winged helix-turn-helix transcriptional regulator [Amycolatopsis pithecellobii]MTD57227.1 MarR family transcriptional regulator [Amycolatopsis pithecellobii]